MTSSLSDTDRLEGIQTLLTMAQKRADADIDFRHAVGSFVQDLDYIRGALRVSPDIWRLNRSFHTVHVPSLSAVLTMLGEIDTMSSVGPKDRYEIEASLNRAALLAKDARHRIEQARLRDAKTELSVLADYVSAPQKTYKQQAGLSRALGRVASTANETFEGAKTGIAALPGLAAQAKDGARDSAIRINAAAQLVGNIRRSLTGKLSDNLMTPISMRLKAGSKALQQGAGAGVGIGVVMSVLCPPLLPLSAAGAVATTLISWQRQIRAAQELNGAQRDQRIARLRAERAEALRKLTGGASSFQMECDDLSLTVDAEAGTADAVILRGTHSGRSWSDLSTTEKAEVTAHLAQGAHAILSILKLTAEFD